MIKNILITGGLGYVGGRVAVHLRSVLPDANIFLTTSKKLDNRPSWSESFNLIEMNLNDLGSIEACMRSAPFDVILHLAAVNEIDSLSDPLNAYHVNVNGTYNLARTALVSGVNRIIYFSTFHVYGQSPEKLITENIPTFPRHPYAVTHRAAEDVLAYFNAYRGMKTIVFRLSNAYGYPMHNEINRWMLVTNDLCRQAVNKQRMVLKTTGQQHRDFISLSDIGKAVELFLGKEWNHWDDGLYNLGGDASISIVKMAQHIADCYQRHFNKRPEIVAGRSEDEITHAVQFSIEKLKRRGFMPAQDLDAEITGTLYLCKSGTPRSVPIK